MLREDLSYKILRVLEVTLPFTAFNLQITWVQYLWEGDGQGFLLLEPHHPTVRELLQEHSQKFGC